MHNIIIQVNEIASNKNWQGAFAELAAYDHLNVEYKTMQSVFYNPIATNINLPSSSGLAKNLGQQVVNLDGLIDDYEVYFDVKTFKDNVEEILQGIYKQLCDHIGVSRLSIIAEYSLDTAYFEFQHKRKDLLDELKSKVNVNDRPTNVSSRVIAGLNYSIQWNAGVNQGIRSYYPYRHAKNLESGVFKYTNKLLSTRPSVLVFVTFPWYNLVISGFANMNVAFYRAYARRIFCQYIHNSQLYSSLDNNYSGTETIHQITQHIVFLEDDTIESDDPNITNAKCFSYVNPNAIKPLSAMAKDYFLFAVNNGMYDDFMNDNY